MNAIRAQAGEDLIFRANAPDQHGRTTDCVRWGDRQRALDVVMTGYQGGNSKLSGTVGAVDLLAKPFSLYELYACVAQQLAPVVTALA